MVAAIIGGGLVLLAGAGSLYMLASAVLLRRFFADARAMPPSAAAVTLLKPLHGAEPRLAENLASFLDQRHDGPIQVVCGVQRADDPAIATVEALVGRGTARVDLVLDPTRHGANGKIANLINMSPHAAHDVLILSDSDIAVNVDYLASVLAALGATGVGAVTCLYRGRGDAGFWSRVAAAGLDWQFLPGAVVGLATGAARPCMGSTIALSRATLERIGGFAAFADVLADDHAIGAAVRGQGLAVAVPPMLVVHGCDERSLAALWRHEVRWARTVRAVTPGAAFAASVVTYPLPIALLGLPFAPLPALTAAGIALGARLVVALTVARIAGNRPTALLLLPLRDCLSLAVFVASFVTRSVDWRGARLTIGGDGRMTVPTETRSR